MTLREAYDKALAIDGKYASVDESLQTYEGDVDGPLHCVTVRCGEMFAHANSFTDAFAKIAQLDPAKAKADKIAKLKAELEELES
jgi:hypothetical protein